MIVWLKKECLNEMVQEGEFVPIKAEEDVLRQSNLKKAKGAIVDENTETC